MGPWVGHHVVSELVTQQAGLAEILLTRFSYCSYYCNLCSLMEGTNRDVPPELPAEMARDTVIALQNKPE